jgi:hypothetical protein
MNGFLAEENVGSIADTRGESLISNYLFGSITIRNASTAAFRLL